LAAYRRYHRKDLRAHSRTYPGCRQLLASLKKKGYLLAIATNRPTAFTRIIIRHLKLEAYLDYVLCADTLRNLKPHPEILRRIMRHLRVGPGQTLFVGDMRVDAQTARNAGVGAVMVTTGSHTPQELKIEKPLRIIRNIAALRSFLP
jgi:phosphoglycolate phosphatase